MHIINSYRTKIYQYGISKIENGFKTYLCSNGDPMDPIRSFWCFSEEGASHFSLETAAHLAVRFGESNPSNFYSVEIMREIYPCTS